MHGVPARQEFGSNPDVLRWTRVVIFQEPLYLEMAPLISVQDFLDESGAFRRYQNSVDSGHMADIRPNSQIQWKPPEGPRGCHVPLGPCSGMQRECAGRVLGTAPRSSSSRCQPAVSLHKQKRRHESPSHCDSHFIHMPIRLRHEDIAIKYTPRFILFLPRIPLC